MACPQQEHFSNLTNWRVAQASEILSPLIRFWADRHSKQPPSPPTTWRKTLLVGADHIGDILYRTASLPFLAQGLPNCSFHFLAPEPAAHVLENNPAITRVHRFSRPEPGSENFQRLVEEKFDSIICYNSGFHAADLFFAVKAGIPNRVGYGHKGLSGLLTLPVHPKSFQPFPAYFRDLTAQLTGLPPDWSLRPLVYPQARHEAEAAAFVSSEGVVDIAFFVTTRQPDAKKWPTNQFAALARWLQETFPCRVVLCGAPQDVEELEKLRAGIGGPCAVNAGSLSLPGLVCWLKSCRMVVALDSAGRHLANCAGTPVFYFRNLRSRTVETGSYLPTEVDLCPPDELVSPERQEAILNAITPASVQSAILKYFRN